MAPIYPSTDRTWPAEAPRAADAVQVGLGVVVAAFLDRHVELDDERNRRHVDAAREHVGGDEEAGGARAKIVQHLQVVPLCDAGFAARSREECMWSRGAQESDVAGAGSGAGCRGCRGSRGSRVTRGALSVQQVQRGHLVA